ncbi:MAG: S8 family peptidase [Verrucomicrobiales bacterium]
MKQKMFILRAPNLGATRDPLAAPRALPQIEAPAEQAAAMRIEVEEAASPRTLEIMRNDPTVLAVAPSMPMKLVKPLDADPGFQPEAGQATWGVTAVGAANTPFTGAGITVAVLDTGIDAAHAAFAGVTFRHRDFTGAGGTNDTNGHGTHCAGTIFGRDLNGLRIGVAPGVTNAIIGKVLDGPQGGGSDILSDAMLWAVENGANVISMSLGIDFPGFVELLVQQNGLPIPAATSIALEGYRANIRLFEQLSNLLGARASVAQTTIVIAAAGNESDRPNYEINVAPPAASSGIVAVAALGQSPLGLQVANFSNTRATIAGPGVNVTSAWPGGGSRAISGTSMATPHVAGVAALWAERLQQQGSLNPVILQARLIASGIQNGLVANVDPLDIGSGLAQAPLALV